MAGGIGRKRTDEVNSYTEDGPVREGTLIDVNQAQKRVDEVVGIMRVNVEKVMEREQSLQTLGNRADELNVGANQFQRRSIKLKRRYWWENIKLIIIFGLLLLVIIIIVIAVVYKQHEGNHFPGNG